MSCRRMIAQKVKGKVLSPMKTKDFLLCVSMRIFPVCMLPLCIFLVCAALLLTACGAGGDSGQGGVPDGGNIANGGNASDGGNVSGEGGAAREQPEWVYVPKALEMDGEMIDFGRMQLVGDTFCCLSRRLLDETSEKQSICYYSLSDEKLTTVPIGWQDEAAIREIGAYTFARDQSLCLIANVYSAGYGNLQRFLCRFDEEGKCLLSQEVTEQLKGPSISGMAADGQGRMYVFTYGEGIWLYGEDGSYCGSIDYDSPEQVRVMEAVCDSEGALYVCLGREGSPDKSTLAKVDFEGKALVQQGGYLPGVIGFCPGTGQGDGPVGEYDFLVYDRRYAYGYDVDTQKQEELFFWLDSDINGEYVKDFGALPDGRLYAIVEDWMNDNRCVTLLTRTGWEQAVQKEELVLATVTGGSELTAMAVNFNKVSEQYHVTVQEYDSLNSLYNAALAWEPMDIIDLSGVNVQRLSVQGFFEDLLPYVDRSEKLGRDDFVEGILDAYTFDNTLVGIPATFYLRTVIGDGTQTGGGTGLTLEELFAAADRAPGVRPFDGITKEELMQYLMMFNEEAFIDWNTGECHFDSAEFVKVLEFVNRFPDPVEGGEDEESLPMKIMSGKVMFAIADIYSWNDLQPYGEIFQGNDACIGFPSADGRGGHLLITGDAFAIAAGSGHKEGAWAFVERELIRGNEGRYDFYANRESVRVSFGLPTLKETLDAMVDLKRESDRDPRNEGRWPMRLYGDWTFTFHALEQKELDAILAMTREARPAFSTEDDVIIQIIHEEAQAYYSGQKSAEDVAAVIQNRVQIYVSENVG